MQFTNKHLKWLIDTGKTVTTSCGSKASIFEFTPDIQDEEVMSAWAKHFRNHYCDDSEIDELRYGTGKTRADYLLSTKLPVQKATAPHEKTGPATRAGDFSEILVSDYMQYLLNYWVPRTRYEFKVNPNLSENGSDAIGFKFSQDNNEEKDELLIYEVKAKLTGNKPVNQLQVAVNDSEKDKFRVTESLNAIKQRLRLKNDLSAAGKIERFQNPTDRPYLERYGAATILSGMVFCENELATTDTSNHSSASSLSLLVIKGNDFMPLVHKLYERAANEA